MEAIKVSASRIQASWFLFTLTQFIFPDQMQYDGARVITTKRKWLGLRTVQDEIRISRVASVRIDTGIFNATITVETKGGATSDVRVHKVPKGRGRLLADRIRQDIPDE